MPRRKRLRCGDVVGVVARDRLLAADPLSARAVSGALRSHVVESVESSYGTAATLFVRFCGVRGLDPWATSAVVLSAFVLFVCLKIKVTSLNMYMAGIRHEYINQTGSWPFQADESLRRVRRYVRRRYPCSSKATKLPISMAVLRVILPLVPGWPVISAMSQDDAAFCVGSVIAVSAFMRGGEAFFDESGDRPVLRGCHLQVREIRGVSTVVVRIPQPKTRWELDVVAVPCFSGPEAGDFWSLKLWTDYLEAFPAAGPQSPAFRRADGSAVSKVFMVNRTVALLGQAGVPIIDIEGAASRVLASSWRAGAVQSAIAAGISESMIMELGRWKSTAWRNYLFFSQFDLQGACLEMWRCSETVEVRTGVHVGSVALSSLVQEEEQAVVAVQARVRTRSVSARAGLERARVGAISSDNL